MADEKTPEQIAAEKEAAATLRFEALEKAVRLMAEGQTTINGSIAAFTQKLEELGKSAGGNGGGGGSDDDVDLETMDRKAFSAHIIGQMKGVLEGAMKPLNERFGQLDEKIDGQGLSQIIKEFSKEHPDFFEWKDEMRELLKAHPTLTPARAYSLARQEASPDRLKKIDEKYGLNKVQENPAEKNFLSLFPNGGGSGSATKGNGAGKMDPKQAAEAAWDHVMSTMGSGADATKH